MGIRRNLLLASASGLASLAFTGLAHANTVNGSVWEVSTGIAQDAIPSNVPTTTPTATFTETAPLTLSGGTNSAAYTIGGFIGSGGGTFLTGSSHSGNSLDGTLFDFTGLVSVTTGQVFTLEHDDGLTLVIDGITVVSVPGPTSASLTTATYTGASGNEAFNLVYGECCGAPAVLDVALPLTSTTPLPAALPLFAGGLGFLGFLGKRRKRNASAVTA